MSKKYKENLSKLIMDKMNDFGLNEIYFTTYIWQMDNKTQLSATDVVYAVTAILESPFNVFRHIERESTASSESRDSVKEEIPSDE